jgi:hypothetical protein
MIKFSEQQLRTPKYMRPVYLVTAGQSKYATTGTSPITSATNYWARPSSTTAWV